MATKKIFFTSLLTLTIFYSFAQNSDAVILKWKLKPGEVITYRTIMQETDTANTKFPSFGGMNKSISDSANANFKKIIEGLKKERESDSTVTIMYEKKKDLINIAMIVKSKPVSDTTKAFSEYQKFRELATKANSGIMLRGIINEEGAIQSFYIKGDQKNLLATFFELPGKAVKVGDSWPIDIGFISMDQNFECDSSYHKNMVSVTHITDTGSDKIVTVKYDITEYVKGKFNSPFNTGKTETMMKFTYQGIANFSVEKGRWIKYDGIMSTVSTGLMEAQSTERYSLIPE